MAAHSDSSSAISTINSLETPSQTSSQTTLSTPTEISDAASSAGFDITVTSVCCFAEEGAPDENSPGVLDFAFPPAFDGCYAEAAVDSSNSFVDLFGINDRHDQLPDSENEITSDLSEIGRVTSDQQATQPEENDPLPTMAAVGSALHPPGTGPWIPDKDFRFPQHSKDRPLSTFAIPSPQQQEDEVKQNRIRDDWVWVENRLRHLLENTKAKSPPPTPTFSPRRRKNPKLRCKRCKDQKKVCDGPAKSIYMPCMGCSELLKSNRNLNLGEICFRVSIQESVFFRDRSPDPQTPTATRLPQVGIELRPGMLTLKFPPQYLEGLADMRTRAMIKQYFDSRLVSASDYLYSHLSQTILSIAISHANKHPESLTADALRLWAACRAMDEDLTFGYTWNGRKALTSHNDRRAITQQLLESLQKTLVDHINQKLVESNPFKWTDCFLAFFLLLDHIDRELIRIYLALPMSESDKTFQQSLSHTAQILLTFYHCVIKSYTRNGVDWFDWLKGPDDASKDFYTTDEYALVTAVKQAMEQDKSVPRGEGDSGPSLLPSDLIWVRYLFVDTWEPPLPDLMGEARSFIE